MIWQVEYGLLRCQSIANMHQQVEIVHYFQTPTIYIMSYLILQAYYLMQTNTKSIGTLLYFTCTVQSDLFSYSAIIYYFIFAKYCEHASRVENSSLLTNIENLYYVTFHSTSLLFNAKQ